MFDITPDDISRLNDSDLRELVGRLCEAELASRGYSPSLVTWGGNQTAKDGGVDVRVSMPSGTLIDGFIPRASTGFQVKSQDIPRRKIHSEMRPKDVIRAPILDLAAGSGAYIIASSRGSVSDTVLTDRRQAMREALRGVPHEEGLHVDFYDQTRLASWVRCHAGVLLWARARVGRALMGWQPYGSWSSCAEDVDAEYLLDERLRLDLGERRSDGSRSITDAIDELRDRIRRHTKAIRLVGLSGVGKTRFVQALFDHRVGARPLDASLAVYTDLSDYPDPQPVALASELIQFGLSAVLIVDNCTPELHTRLAQLCSVATGTVSLITVEYDVRDDKHERTQVVRLDTSSADLIEQLVTRRYPHISAVDVRTIASNSGGNARIAIVLADTVEPGESLAALNSDEIFQRIFRLRHATDPGLLRAAQVCSLVYSFSVESADCERSELASLASLARQTPDETHEHVSELRRRQVIQQRGTWRAVLPHAIANRLAGRALEDIPYERLEQEFVQAGAERLLKSFARRLSFLHDHSSAIAIVRKWLSPTGLIGDVATLNELGRVLFGNVAPVLPEAALEAIERVGQDEPAAFGTLGKSYRVLLRSLAYDASLFERSAKLLTSIAMHTVDERERKEVVEIFASLFTLYFSGTHATVEQRIAITVELLESHDESKRALGFAAIAALLRASRFGAGRSFEFGARSRDYGYRPSTAEDTARWFSAVLRSVEKLALGAGQAAGEIRELLAQNFADLWRSIGTCDDLERIVRGIAAQGLWCEGWVRCRETLFLRHRRSPHETDQRLVALVKLLQPTSLPDRVRAMVVAQSRYVFDLDVVNDNDRERGRERADLLAEQLGAEVAQNDSVFVELLPEIVGRAHRAWWFGAGLFLGSATPQTTWRSLVDALGQCDPDLRSARVLQGFLWKLNGCDKDGAQRLLDEATNEKALWPFLPDLHMTVGLDERGAERLVAAARDGKTPGSVFQHMHLGASAAISSEALRTLIFAVADQPDGLEAAFDLFESRILWNRTQKVEHEPWLLAIGRALLARTRFADDAESRDYELGDLVRICMAGSAAAESAVELARRLASAIISGETQSYRHPELQQALLRVQPLGVLEAFYLTDYGNHLAAVDLFDHIDSRSNPADVIPADILVEWCERGPDERYVWAAYFITFAGREQAGEPLMWTEQALALLSHAPDIRRVLEVFVERFTPTSWSGSLAAIMEANVALLDRLYPAVITDLEPFLLQTKRALLESASRQRIWEAEREKVENERFE